ncbi:MAG: polysaccharide deacetylase family protein [Reyranellaceae bacterium]
MSGDFAPLLQVLDRYADTGRVASLWWRDDDAARASPALERLLQLSAAYRTPLALAVVPALAQDCLARVLAAAATPPAVLQHGYAHQNHAAAGEKKIELGPQRPAQIVVGELATGWLRLETLFAGRALPVLVPPWNRLAPFLVPILPELGYRGLSQFGARARAMPVKHLRQVNCHVDPIDWRGGTGFVGAPRAAAALAARLAQVLESGEGAESEPTGLMTHHAAHDAALWGFLDTLLSVTNSHPAARWLPAREVFAL